MQQRLIWGVLGGLLASPIVRVWQDHNDGILIVTVRGRSMQPTLEPNQIWFCHGFNKQWKRGDVVLLRSPTNPDVLFVKRIIAMEGDILISKRIYNARLPSFPSSFWVPKGYAWVEGDNASTSNDSSAFGPVPLASIVAHVAFPLKPLLWKSPDPFPIPNHRVIPSPLPPSLINHWRIRDQFVFP